MAAINMTDHDCLSYSRIENHARTANLINNHQFYLHHHHYFNSNRLNFDYVSIKSKIGVEFRRYALKREHVQNFDSFYQKVEQFHHLDAIPFVIFYTDSEGSYLPINNNDNLAKAISSAKHIKMHNNQTFPTKRPFLKLYLEKKDIFLDHYNGTFKKKPTPKRDKPSIGVPEDFRQVSSIIDADLIRDTCRRVRISKRGSDRPLGFYIRDGTYKRINSRGQLEIVTGIFISRLIPGGLAESTGLLAVNDEVLEVNGIKVPHDQPVNRANDIYVSNSRRLDQVRDMMVANSSDLIITTRPAKPFNHNKTNHYDRANCRNITNFNGRDRLSSTQSNNSDLGEDFIRHHMS